MISEISWWMLPLATFVMGVAWVFWPRPEEWRSHGDYSVPDGTIYAPARAAVALIAFLLAVVMWRW